MKRILVIALVVFLVVTLTPTATYLVLRAKAVAKYQAAYNEEVRLLLADGGSLHLADLAPKPIQDADNAARFIAQMTPVTSPRPAKGAAGRDNLAVSFMDPNVPEEARAARAWHEFYRRWRGASFLMRTASASTPEDQRPIDEWDDRWTPLLAKYLDLNRSNLELIKQAAASGRAVFAVNWDSLTPAEPHRGKIREGAQLLQLDAALKARTGDTRGAMEDVRLAWRLRRLIEGGPALVDKLSAFSDDSRAAGILHEVLTLSTPDRESVAALLAELDDREQMNDMQRAFLGEAATAPLALQEALKQSRPSETWLARFTRVDPAEEYHLLKLCREYRERAALEFPEALAGGTPAPSAIVLGRRVNTMAAMLQGAWERALIQAAASDARVRGTRAALALALYKADNGSYPDTLSSLVPRYMASLPIDPFSGQPLMYRPAENGYVLYSVYKNKCDDGGTWDGDLPWTMDR